MAESLDEAVKLLILLSHRAAVLDDTRLNGRVDALVNSYLAGDGTDTASKRKHWRRRSSKRHLRRRLANASATE